MEEFVANLPDIIASEVVFVYANPEIVDFTINKDFELFICGVKKNLKVIVNDKNLFSILGILKSVLVGKTLMTWNIKPLFSLVLFRSKKQFILEDVQILDLKILESYSGIRLDCPKNLVESINRLKFLKNNFPEYYKVYTKIHLPLLTKVIPDIETFGILDIKDKKEKYSYYEIEGQQNGRLLCHNAFKKCFLPHTLCHEDKNNLKLRGTNEVFMLFDYKHMEVSVLQWLSGDENLKAILNSEKDIYEVFYEEITGNPCDSVEKRNLCKLLFLPIFYGMSAKSIMKEFDYSYDYASHILNKIKSLFPVAYAWIEEQQRIANKDYFGRVRNFAIEERYKARNFVVQSAAATICLEKLISLNKVAKIVYYVHDGYCISCDQSSCQRTFREIVGLLEEDLYPDLHLRVECKIGYNLNKMISCRRKGAK